MIDQKYLELINAEADGELPDEQRAELSRYLLANPEARAFREDLRNVCAALDRIEQVEPPHDLKDSIIRAIAAQAPVQARTASRQAGQAPRVLRYAAAFAGGLLVSAIAFQVGFESRGGVVVTDLVGTMAGSGVTAAAKRIDSLRLDHAQLEGEVSLYAAGTALVLSFEVVPRQPTDVLVVTEGHEERFSWNAAGTSQRLRHAIALGEIDRVGRIVTVRFSAGGELVQEGVFEVPAAR